MFKLESYITPLLMGYLDKYVKLRQEDFQLSLWGGDAVLNNLDLRLDELEKVLQLPVMFRSGHIHELRLHVPWTKLGYEPVVITINTVECILKVRDTAYETSSSTQSVGTPGKSFQQKQKMKRQSLPGEDLPPGYLQGIVNRIINNVSFIINNLILKFVEDDIVLSVNIKSAECYSVDKEWNRAFVELTAEDLALRKVLNFADLTVCLDKTNSSGHIESYQEPVAYRCAVTCRLIMEYESITAKFPRVTRFNLYCETLTLSLTDTQLPMLVRLIELCIAMYYGTLDIPSSSSSSDHEATDTAQSEQSIDTAEVKSTEWGIESFQAAEQGWVSWAWSYVPQLVSTDEEDEIDKQMAEQGMREKPAPHILSLGFYIHQGGIIFKLTEKSKESTELPHKKMHFHPFLKLSGEGLGIEILIQGLTFFNIQCGFTWFKLTTCGNCICGVSDEKVARCNTLLSGGERLDKKIGLTYISNSLFDDVGWENRGQKSQHIVDGDEHKQVFTEQFALQRFGAFWIDSLYTLEKSENHGAGSNSSENDNSEPIFQKEFSNLRFVFGNTHLHFSSTLFHRVSKLIECAKNHQYQPYGSTKPNTSVPNEERPIPTDEQIHSLEEFIPTQLLHLMLINPTVTILSAEHPHCDVAKKNYKSRLRKRDSKAAEDPPQPLPIPSLVLSTPRFDLQVTKPMYPGRLVKLVTTIAGPSSNLLHHCHAHTQIKLFSVQLGLQKANWDGTLSRALTLIPPCSFALYSRSLLLPKLWTSSSLPLTEWMYEIPNASVNVNKASVLLCCRVVSSWLAPPQRQGVDHGLDDSLLDDVFPASGESTHHNYPLLEMGIYGLEFKSCESALVNACVGSLSSLHVFLYTPGIGGKMSVIPIVYGPNDTSSISDPRFFTQPLLEKTEIRSDCLTATFQKPKHTSVSEAQALALVDCQGFCVWLDPGLISWFHYCPQPRPGRKGDQPMVTLDLSLAQMTSPLNAVSHASAHSTSSTSHHGLSRQQTSISHPAHGQPASIPEETIEEGEGENDSTGQMLAQYFPLIRMLHVQVELKPSAIFLPKTTVPNSESSSDISAIVHQARHGGRLSDTLVLCVPSIMINSTMTKPMSVAQDLPVTSIQGSLIGEKLPWTVKIGNACAYSLLSGHQEPLFILHPMDIVSTVAVTCKYNPPTSEIISTLALCLHVDVGQPKIDISAAQLHLCSTSASVFFTLLSNATKLSADCLKLFRGKLEEKPSLFPSRAPTCLKKSVSSTYKIESLRSAEVTENVTTDISEDFSHEGSPLHESLIDDAEESGVKLSVWLQLMVPKLRCTIYSPCASSQQENGFSLMLEHFDLSLDSQNVYSKAKVTLGSISIQHSVKSQDGSWSWADPGGIVLSCTKQLPRNLHTVTNKMWTAEHTAPVSFAQPQEAMNRDKKHGVLSVTFTRALCKNVKKRLRKANIELPSVNELDPIDSSVDADSAGSLRHEDVDFYFHEFLSEICVKTEPFDIVVKPDFVDVFISLIYGLGKREKKQKFHSVSGRPDLPKLSYEQNSKSNCESASVHNLPLVYADLGMIRVFILKSKKALTEIRSQPNLDSSSQAQTFGMEASTHVNLEIDTSQPQSPSFSPELSNLSMSKAKMDATSTVQTTQPQSRNVPLSSQQQEAVSHTMKARGEGPKPCSDICSTLLHDMVLIQMNSCLLQPHADNPLPRTAHEKNIFLHAVQSGFTHQPGAVIEDRQYQMDVRGVTLSTGVWDQVMQQIKQREWKKSPSGSMVQIPALDWNTFLMDSPAQEVKDIKLIPIVTPFDLCFVVAPPITYIAKKDSLGSDRKARLICGFTTELNLTSDLDLYLSVSQIKFLAEVVTQFTQCIASKPWHSSSQASQKILSPKSFQDGKKKSQQPFDFLGAGFDSGVESDLSTLTFDRGQRHVPHRQSSQTPVTPERRKVLGLAEGATKYEKIDDELEKSMLPVDILITAGRISCTIYTHKTLEEDFTLEMPLLRERHSSHRVPSQSFATETQSVVSASDNLEDALKAGAGQRNSVAGGNEVEDREDDYSDNNGEQFTVFSFMKQVPEDILKKVIPQGSVCILPFVYLYLTQPHCIVAKHGKNKGRIEVSCYDVLIKGASDKHISAIDEYHVIPDSADFNIHWLETRAGCPHPHTGIPPSLLTVRFVQDSSVPDTVSLSVERPVRLRISQLAIEQAVDFSSELIQLFPIATANKGCEQDVEESSVKQGKTELWPMLDMLSLADKLEISSAQVVVAMEMNSSDTNVGMVVSWEGVAVEADINKSTTDSHPSVTARISLKDLFVKTCYDKKSRQLIGPLSVNMDACLSWVLLTADKFMPQVLLVAESSLIPLTFGQEHVFSLTELMRQVTDILQLLKVVPESEQACQSLPVLDSSKIGTNLSHSKPVEDFVQDRTHDDLRNGRFQFIEQSEGSPIQPDTNEIVFTSRDPECADSSCMSWCYPQPRVITNIHLTPVPFSLTSNSLSLDSNQSGLTTVPCVLQYWDELRGEFVDVVEFHLSENEPVTVSLPEPKPVNASELVVARIWRVLLPETTQDDGSSKCPSSDVAVLPASLAVCMCVDSVLIPSLIPTLLLSVSVPAAELHLCNHMEYNGTELPKKLRMYQMCTEGLEEQVFAVAKINNMSATLAHVLGQQLKTSVKLSMQTSLDVLEYGHLTMDEVIPPSSLSLTVNISAKGKKQDVNCSVKTDKLRLKVGKSCVHTLNMAVSAWTTFNPKCSGSHLIFNNYVMCNNTTSTIRFGQAGTDENIILNSLEICAYSWRSYISPQMLHLCMDKPTWKWTEPFSVDKEGTSVCSVVARDQSYVVIIKVKRLSNLQMQITVFGQVIIANHLSQPVSVKIGQDSSSHTNKYGNGTGGSSHYTIQPGRHLPSLVSNDILLSPIQIRLAGYSTSWSHDIYLSGDRMKDNQMVKIQLPDGASYFHVWCRIFCQHFQGLPQKLAMLTPLYVVRTHLPRPLYLHLDSPKVKQSQEIMVRSQGQEFQLHCMGGDITHQLSFRLGSDMLLSSPPVVLSTGLIGQLTRSQVTSVDVEQLCEQKLDVTYTHWPYLTEEPSTTVDIDPAVGSISQMSLLDHKTCTLKHVSSSDDSLQPQSGIDLNLHLSEYIPGCDTLLVEVTPPYLVHNATDIDIVLHGSEDRHWNLKSGHTIAPPLQQDKFKMSVKCLNTMSCAKTITMSAESMDYRRYNDEIGKVLFIDGYVHTSYQIFFQEANKMEMVFITVTSDLQHEIRVICIRERFAMTNQTDKNLTVKLLALPLSPQPVQMSDMETVTIASPAKVEKVESNTEYKRTRSQTPGPQPLFRWSTVRDNNSIESSEEADTDKEEATYVYYISFSLDKGQHFSTQNQWKWSLPVRLISSKDGHRMTTSIPAHDSSDLPANVHSSSHTAEESNSSTPMTNAFCVATQQVRGVTYVVVSNDAAPACVVENLCPFALQFGQMCDKLTSNDAVIQEQVELVSDLPWVPPGGWCHYTPPLINLEFASKETVTIPKLHFRSEVSESLSSGPSEWSTGVQISGNTDVFVRIPNCCDLKIMIQMVGMVTHLVIRPVSKAEITAKEIRSRIKNHGEVKRLVVEKGKEKAGKFGVSQVKWEVETSPSLPSSSSTTSSESDEASSLAPSAFSLSPPASAATTKKPFTTYLRFPDKEKWRKLKEGQQKISFTFGVLCDSFILALQDESNAEHLSDLMCLHLKDLFLALYPVSRGPESVATETSVAVSIGKAQIDNQHYGIGVYDFPVVLIPQKDGDSQDPKLSTPEISDSMSVVELHAIMRSKAFLHVQVVTFSEDLWQESVLDSVDMSIKPFSLYVDDTFIYRVVQELEYFVPSRLSFTPPSTAFIQGTLNRRLPTVVKLNSYTLSHPIRVKHMTIQPIKMLLSVHASLKLFLASDHTPLSVSKFERAHVFSTLQRLAHALTVHYATAAVFRAGIVVGSLEILGNPTGLVRSLGTGVSDLISLPYAGLTRGPGAFVSGLSRGMGSLVKNVSAGMITSVTNFASSVSRNMDRLSFDTTHLERQEENRRNRPVGLSDGLRQGLTGFGISLLGAVAGLADQPIQTILASGSQDERRASASSAASGFVTGVGKGLVGVFTKPIGGAAEFVSQTGQGILHGTGLGQLPSRLEKPSSQPQQNLPNSQYKYSVKIFSNVSNPDILLAAPALTYDFMGAEVKVQLLLTSDVVVVVNTEEDAQQQALALSELECRRSFDQEGMLILQWMDHFYKSSSIEQSRNSNKDRIAAFIDTQNANDLPLQEPLPVDQSASRFVSSSPPESVLPLQSQSEPRLPSTSSQPEGMPTTAAAVPSQSLTSPQYEFQMEPHMQDLFITMFRLAKNRLQGRGFPVVCAQL